MVITRDKEINHLREAIFGVKRGPFWGLIRYGARHEANYALDPLLLYKIPNKPQKGPKQPQTEVG